MKRGLSTLNRGEQAAQPKTVSLITIGLVFLKVGAFTFGGGYAMLPIIKQEVCTRRGWICKEQFLDLLVVAQSLPGAIALNCSILVGMRLRGIAGGIAGALGMIIPSVAVILVLVAYFLPLLQENVYVKAIFYGLRPAVVALVGAAVVNLGRAVFQHWAGAVLAGVLLAAALLLKIHPVAILLAGGFSGLLIFREKAD